MKGMDMMFKIIILLVLGLVILIISSVFLREIMKPLEGAVSESELRDCCRRYAPACIDPTVICGDEDKTPLNELARKPPLNIDTIDKLKEFCGCNL